MDTYLVYVTVADISEAERIARTSVEERLAACANVMGGIHSFYRWEGKVCDGEEAALILKTTENRREALQERIKQLHSYECPCIVFLPVSDGNPDFLKWVADETQSP
jgi:periplasmic divalent cation tolerance protein